MMLSSLYYIDYKGMYDLLSLITGTDHPHSVIVMGSVWKDSYFCNF